MVVKKDISEFVSDEGVVTEDIKVVVAPSAEPGAEPGVREITIDIPKGTAALNKEGEPLEGIDVEEVAPHTPPAGKNIIGMPYDFGPDGATFDPPIDITFRYDPADIPEEVAPETLIIAYYDTVSGRWVELENIVVDPVTHTVTGKASHFTVFAVLVPAVSPETNRWWIWLMVGLMLAGIAAYILVKRRAAPEQVGKSEE
jgi:hypothetical protein